jgi:hypothetical protein
MACPAPDLRGYSLHCGKKYLFLMQAFSAKFDRRLSPCLRDEPQSSRHRMGAGFASRKPPRYQGLVPVMVAEAFCEGSEILDLSADAVGAGGTPDTNTLK